MPEPHVSKDTFLAEVERRGDLGSVGEARTATRATMETLDERLARGEVEDLGDFLPARFQNWLMEDQDVEAGEFDAEAFVDRVAEREGVDHERAHHHAQAVCEAMELLLPEPELDRTKQQLPEGYHTFFA